MTDHDVQPPIVFEIDQPKTYDSLFLHSASEVMAYMRAINTHHAFVTAYIDAGHHFYLTQILSIDVDTKHFYIDIPQSEEARKFVQSAKQFTLVASLDRVSIQIRVPAFEQVQLDGQPALRAPLPKSILRLQRREFFRLETPLTNRPQCKIAWQQDDGNTQVLTLPVLDISGGGVGLMEQEEHAANFPSGQIYEDCRLEIPGEGFIAVSLRVRKTQVVDGKNGKNHLRVGCQFANLSGARLAQIERYITRTERERKAKLSGLA